MKPFKIGQGFLFWAVILTLNGFPQTIWNDVGHIPVTDQVDWTNAGLIPEITPTEAEYVFNVSEEKQQGETWFDVVIRGLQFAAGNPGTTIIYFPSSGGYNGTGRYDFVTSISGFLLLQELNMGNIIFQGDGPGTVLHFDIGAGWAFLVRGQIVTPIVKAELTTTLTKGSKTFSVNNSNGFQEGDWIVLEQENFYLHNDCHECDNWSHIGQITQIQSKSGNQITIKDEASKLYEPMIFHPDGLIKTTITKIDPIKNVGFENLKIERFDPQYATSGCQKCNNIYFDYAVNCWVKGVEFYKTPRHHIVANFSSHIEVSGCYFNDAIHHGGGGYGYGVLLHNCTTNCLIENNIFRKLRHSMLVQAGSNCNVFTYNYSRERTWNALIGSPSEITLHGNYPYANLYEHNIVMKIDADESSGGQGSHGYNGPYNAFLRNIVYQFNSQEPPFDIFDDEFYLNNAPRTAILGCELSDPIFVSGVTSTSINLYGIVGSYPNGFHYANGVVNSTSGGSARYLADVSYYYSTKPHFLEPTYAWLLT